MCVLEYRHPAIDSIPLPDGTSSLHYNSFVLGNDWLFEMIAQYLEVNDIFEIGGVNCSAFNSLHSSRLQISFWRPFGLTHLKGFPHNMLLMTQQRSHNESLKGKYLWSRAVIDWLHIKSNWDTGNCKIAWLHHRKPFTRKSFSSTAALSGLTKSSPKRHIRTNSGDAHFNSLYTLPHYILPTFFPSSSLLSTVENVTDTTGIIISETCNTISPTTSADYIMTQHHRHIPTPRPCSNINQNKTTTHISKNINIQSNSSSYLSSLFCLLLVQASSSLPFETLPSYNTDNPLDNQTHRKNVIKKDNTISLITDSEEASETTSESEENINLQKQQQQQHSLWNKDLIKKPSIILATPSLLLWEFRHHQTLRPMIKLNGSSFCSDVSLTSIKHHHHHHYRHHNQHSETISSSSHKKQKGRRSLSHQDDYKRDSDGRLFEQTCMLFANVPETQRQQQQQQHISRPRIYSNNINIMGQHYSKFRHTYSNRKHYYHQILWCDMLGCTLCFVEASPNNHCIHKLTNIDVIGLNYFITLPIHYKKCFPEDLSFRKDIKSTTTAITSSSSMCITYLNDYTIGVVEIFKGLLFLHQIAVNIHSTGTYIIESRPVISSYIMKLSESYEDTLVVSSEKYIVCGILGEASRIIVLQLQHEYNQSYGGENDMYGVTLISTWEYRDLCCLALQKMDPPLPFNNQVKTIPDDHILRLFFLNKINASETLIPKIAAASWSDDVTRITSALCQTEGAFELPSCGSISALAFGGPGNQYIITGTQGGRIHIWDLCRPFAPILSLLDIEEPIQSIEANSFYCLIFTVERKFCLLDFYGALDIPIYYLMAPGSTTLHHKMSFA